jgi:hypothetical protein
MDNEKTQSSPPEYGGATGSVDPWPEIKCGNNRCPWRGMWNDLPQRASDTPNNGKKTIPMTVSVCPLCGSAEFWEIDPPNNKVSGPEPAAKGTP